MKKKPLIYCHKCAHLLLIKTKTGALPLCVATAKFLPGPIRSRVDIAGVTGAVKRNLLNDCVYYRNKLFTSKYINDVKTWVREDINAAEATIKDYSIESETAETKRFADEENEKISRRLSAEKEDGTETEAAFFDKENFDGWENDAEREYSDNDSVRSESDPNVDEEVTEDGCDTEGCEEETSQGVGGESGPDSDVGADN